MTRKLTSEFLDLIITDLEKYGLDGAIATRLYDAGYTHVRKLSGVTDEDLLCIDQMGMKKISEIRLALVGACDALS